MFEGEVFDVGGFCVAGEDSPSVWVGGELDDGLGHGRAVPNGRVEAAVGVAYDFRHPTYVRHQSGEAGGHRLKKRHREPFGDGRHGVDVRGGEEAGYIEALSPEGDVVGNSKFVGEDFERFAHDARAHDPELKVGDCGYGEGDGLDHRWKVFNLDQTANEEEREAALLGKVFGWAGLKPVDSVVDAGDAAALSERSIAEVHAGGVADGYDPIAEEGDEVVGDLGLGVVRRCDEAVTRGDDGLNASEPRRHGSLQGWRRVVAVDDVWPRASKHTEKAHGGACYRAFANDVDMKAFRSKHFKKRPQAGIDADGDVVPVGAL